jgi:osmotically-inducible protein OsmY
MKRIPVLSAVCLTIALAAPGSCSAQQSSLFGGGSSGGRTSTGQSGSSGMGSMGSAASALGSSMGGSRGGTGSGTGSRTGSTAGGVQQPQFNSFGSVGNSIGQGSFVGRSDNSGRFVGQTQAGQQNAQGGMGLGRMGGGGRNGNNNGNNNNGNNNFGGGGNQQAQQRRVRPQLKVAFPTPAIQTATVTTTLQQRLSTHETMTAGSLKNVNLTMEEGGVVTLRGEVASQDAKSLAAAMVRLEPGVRKVVNELTITQ